MFTIRNEQAQALGDEDLARRIAAHLRARHPAQVAALAPEDLRAAIFHGFEVARSYAVTSERGLFTFVLDMLAVGPHFHLQPKIRAILGQTAAPEPQRLDRIVDDVDDASWDEAGRLTDPVAYWDEVLAKARPKP